MALKPIGYVQASWHADIIDHCKTAFMAGIITRGYRVDEVEFFSAPGSLEIPLIAKKLAKSGRYAAVCASGLIVDGGIYRHEFVAHAVLQGIVQTALEIEVPILFRNPHATSLSRSRHPRGVLQGTHAHEGPGAGGGLRVDHRKALCPRRARISTSPTQRSMTVERSRGAQHHLASHFVRRRGL